MIKTKDIDVKMKTEKELEEIALAFDNRFEGLGTVTKYKGTINLIDEKNKSLIRLHPNQDKMILYSPNIDEIALERFQRWYNTFLSRNDSPYLNPDNWGNKRIMIKEEYSKKN